MRIRSMVFTRAKVGLVVVVAVLALGIDVEPAFADDPVPVPISPEEIVPLDEGGEFVPEDPVPPVAEPCKGVGCPPAPICDSGYAYGVYSNLSNDMRIFDRWFVTNSTGSTISATFRADTGGIVTATAGITLTAEASALVFAKVSASVNASISRSMTASTGVSAASSVRPYSTLKGDYGIWRERVTMKRYYMYSNCRAGTTQYFSYYAPYRKGWRVYY